MLLLHKYHFMDNQATMYTEHHPVVHEYCGDLWCNFGDALKYLNASSDSLLASVSRKGINMAKEPLNFVSHALLYMA